MSHLTDKDTIAALATPPGHGAIAVLRLSGPSSFPILDRIFKPAGNAKMPGRQPVLSFGRVSDGEEFIDEVLVSMFHSPHSYTGEDVVEISCHGSPYIQQRILKLLGIHGARLAMPGEFTQRAFLNGKLDLSQAEAVADLVAAGSAAEHKLALEQMRGGYSAEMKALRDRLIYFASLIELELDFAEEDVQFADRKQLTDLVNAMSERIATLLKSFEMGNVLREGIPVAIAGKPNAGKSTLLNALLKEERALVSDIPGTTRDTVEEKVVIDGIPYRFIDTAGIRDASDTVERMGVDRTFEKLASAAVILYVFDPAEEDAASVQKLRQDLIKKYSGATVSLLCNKSDLFPAGSLKSKFSGVEGLSILSAKKSEHLDAVHTILQEHVLKYGLNMQSTVVTSARHAEALRSTLQALEETKKGIATGLSGDLLSVHIRSALHHLGSITGEIVTDDLLKNIFERFCIGK